MRNRFRRACIGWASCAALAFVIGCGGSDGKDGAPGPQGPEGPAGPEGPPGESGTTDPSVSAVSPNRAFLERRSQVTISGYGTEWSGAPTVDFGPGITVEDVTVASPTALVATITVADDAALGVRDVSVSAEGGSITYEGAFEVAAPLEALVVGTQAQGSILFARAEMLDKSTPFDTLSSSTFTLQAGDNSVGVIQDAAAFTAEALLFLDVDAASGPTDVVALNGLPGIETSSRHPGAFDTADRAPTPLVVGAPATDMYQEPLGTLLYSFTTSPNVVTIVTSSASSPDAAPAFALLPATGSFDDLISFGAQAAVPAGPGGEMYYVVYWDNTGTASYDATIELAELPSDEAQANDDCMMAQAAMLPASLQNLSLSDATDEDWFAIDVDAAGVGGVLHVVTSPGEATTDTVVEVFAADCTTSIGGPSSDADYHEDWMSAPLPAAGTYYVRVTNSTFGYSGALYNLDIELIPSDPFEPNNACAAATAATLPAALSGATLSDELDEDWYEVTVDASAVGGQFHVVTSPGDANTDTYVEVFADDCITSIGGPSSDADYHEDFTSADIPAAGTYFVRVSHSPDYPYAGSAYELSIDLIAPPPPTLPDAYEPNDACAAASAVTLPASLQDLNFPSNMDEDWFAITVDAAAVGSSLQVITSPGDTNTDTVIDVLASDCTTSLGGPSSDADYHEDFTSAPIPAAGTYYVRVYHSSYPYAGAVYDMSIALIAPPPPPPPAVPESEPNDDSASANAAAAAGSASFSGAIGVAGDNDWFEVTAPAGATITATVTAAGADVCGPTGDVDSEIEIYDASAASLAFNEDISGASNYCSSATTTASAAGTYYVRVASSFDWAPMGTFSYSLLIDVTP